MAARTDNNAQNDKVNYVGPDYGQMIKHQTNGAIIEAFISMLFSKDTNFDTKTFMTMVRNLIILVGIKTGLEESKTYIDKFKFTDLKSFKYFCQRLKYSEKRYDIIKVSEKWMYGDDVMSKNTLTPFLESKQIYIDQQNTYYYSQGSFLIKVIITANKISFCIPNTDSMIKYANNDIIYKNREVTFGGKTTMWKAMIQSQAILKLEPTNLAHAFETDNYVKLEKSIIKNFLVDNCLQFQRIPFCINFDGKPGTGKTTFASYIATKGIFKQVIVYNLIQSSKCDFTETIKLLEKQLNQISSKDKKPDDDDTVLIIFDEIDKWLDSHINHKIHTLREEARGKKEVKKDEASQPVTIQSFEKLTKEEEEEKALQIKKDFLDQLMRLIDGWVLQDTRKYVIIFNTNNFNKLFENVNVEGEKENKYDALRNRFQRYHFKLSGKDEIIKYLKSINDKLYDAITEDKMTEEQKKAYMAKTMEERIKFKEQIGDLLKYDDSIYDQIPDNISISYRSLVKILRFNCFDIEQTVNFLSNPSLNKNLLINDDEENNVGGAELIDI
jgi:hypothetical protein